VAGKSAGGESKINQVYLIYEGVKLRARGRLACFIFFCLCTTTRLETFLFFILPSSSQQQKKTVPYLLAHSLTYFIQQNPS
jgi:hypothetical protein